MQKILDNLKNAYDREQFFPTYLSILIHPFYFLRKGLVDKIKENSNYMKGTMLDFGCGCKPYIELFNVDQYVGIDIKRGLSNHCREQADIFYDGSNMPFKDALFDAIFSSEVIEHIFDIDNVLEELKRVLKINGLMLITVPFTWDEHEIPFDFARYTSFGLQYLLEKHGFEVLRHEKSTNYVQTIFQMWNSYLFHILFTKSNIINVFINILCISPFTILGVFLSHVLPIRFGYFNNNIVIARKVQ